MKKFLVHIIGKGEGCDYTIGCNHAVEIVNAESLEEAKKKWWDSFEDGHFVADEYSAADIKEAFEGNTHSIPESAEFYEIVGDQSYFDFGGQYKELWAEAMKREQDEEKEEELAQLARLKAKYEPA